MIHLSDNDSSVELTGEEQHVLRHLAEGKTIADISLLLSLPLQTIESLRQTIMEKLKLYTVADLTKYAIQKKITSLNSKKGQ